MAGEKDITVGLAHGAFHGGWCFEFLEDELNHIGFKTVSVDLPIDDPEADFNDHSDVVVEALKHEKKVALLGHSRAGNIVPRAAGRLAIVKMIFLCSAFEPSTIQCLPPRDPNVVEPPMVTQEYLDGLQPEGGEMFSYNRTYARRKFYPDCPRPLQGWACGNLRIQRRSLNEPILEEWPDVPQSYIYCEDDLVVSPEWSKIFVPNRLGIEPIPFPGGHSPFLSRPLQLAHAIASLIE